MKPKGKENNDLKVFFLRSKINQKNAEQNTSKSKKNNEIIINIMIQLLNKTEEIMTEMKLLG